MYVILILLKFMNGIFIFHGFLIFDLCVCVYSCVHAHTWLKNWKLTLITDFIFSLAYNALDYSLFNATQIGISYFRHHYIPYSMYVYANKQKSSIYCNMPVFADVANHFVRQSALIKQIAKRMQMLPT